MKGIWGSDCGRISIVGNRVKTVNAKNGKESELYGKLVDYVKELPKDEKESLKDKYRDWEGKYIHTVDDDKHLALALYSQTTSKNFIDSYKGEKDANNEPIFDAAIQQLNSPSVEQDKMYSLNAPEALDRIVKGFGSSIQPKYLYGKFVGYTTKTGRNVTEVATAIDKWISGKPDFSNVEVFTSSHGTINFRDKTTGRMYNLSPDLEGSKASPETIKMYEEFIKRSGFDLKELAEGLVDENGNKISASGAVTFVKQLVEVALDKKDTALGEEASHIAVKIIRKNDPTLFKQMMNEIGKYDIFSKVVDEYSKSKDYQLENGKPNIPKLKEEAIGKVFNELVIKKLEGNTEKPELIAKAQTWWDKVKDFFKGLVNKFGADLTLDAIDKGAEQFADKENDQDSPFSSDSTRWDLEYEKFYQQQRSKADKIFDKVKSVFVDKKDGKYKVGNEEVKPVTTLANQVIKDVTRDISKQNERIEDFKKELELGERNYQDIVNIFDRYIDKTTGVTNRNEFGRLVDTEEAATSQINPRSSDAYDSLEKYIIGYEENGTHVNGLLDQYPKDTKFMWDENIYKPGEKGYASNIHFLAIMPDGTSDRLHFGFIDGLRSDKPNTDIPQWKKDAYTKIISASGNTLKSEYGIDGLRKNRLVPISNQYKYNNKTDEKLLTGIKIGEIDFSKIKSDTLLPLPSDVERTGNKQIDAVLDKAFAKIENLEKQKRGKTGEERKNLEEQIKQFEKSLRYYLVKQDVSSFTDFGLTYIKNKTDKYKNYIQLLKDGKQDSISQKEINDVSMEFTKVLQDLSIYNNVHQAFKKEYSENSPELLQLTELHNKAFDLVSEVEELRNEWGEKCIANRFNIINISAPEVTVGWIQENFNPLSAARTKNTQLLFHMVNDVYQKATLDDIVENKKVEDINKDIQKWLETNSQEKLEKMFFKKQANGSLSMDPVSKLSKKFYEELATAQKISNVTWMEHNLDLKRYREDYKKLYADEENRVNNTNFSNDPILNTEYREKALQSFKEKYDISNRTAFGIGNDELKKYVIEDKWYSDEYREMKNSSNAPVLKLYQYLESRTRHAYEIGALHSWRSIIFPQVPKSFVENFTYGIKGNVQGFKNMLKNTGKKLTTEQFSGGEVNDLTGEKEHSLHVAYMRDLGEEIDARGNKDYSNVSRKIFENIAQWNSELSKYKYYSQVEGNVLLIKSIEDNKNHLVTDNFGEPVRKEGGGFEVEKGNKKNADLYKFMMDSGFYGDNKSSEDQGLGGFIAYNKTADKINNFLGYNVLPKSKNEKVFISAANTMRATNQFITYKVLGYNPLTAISNIFGGSMNNYLNAGTHFTRTDFLKNQMRLSGSILSLPEGKAYTGLLKYFNPYTESHSSELVKSLSVSQFQKQLNGLDLMSFMRFSDRVVESISAMSYFDNTMVENGKLVNIREYVREQNDIRNLYSPSKYSSQQRKEVLAKIEREIEDLKSKRSLPKITKIDNDGNVTIPNIEQLSDTVANLRSRIQQVSREALGNRTPIETAKINSTMFGQALMLFHNWIPALVRKRYQDTAYNPGAGEYQEGRWKMVHSALKGRILSGTKDLVSHMLGGESSEDSLINIAKKRYAEKAAKFRELEGVEEGQSMFEKTTPEHRYIENYLNEVKAGMYEILSTMSMLSLYLSFRTFMKPDKNEDFEAKGRYKYAVRMLDKLSDELLFFYSPNSFQQLVSTKVFPAISVLGDIESFVEHGSKELWYDFSGDEEAASKHKTAKYVLRNIPVVDMITWHTALFWEQFDKDYGITIQANYQTR